MSKVYFASAKMSALKADASLPAKFKRMLAGLSLKDMFEGKSVAIKMHLGGNLGYSTIPPTFVRLLVGAVKDAGGHPFVTDGTNAIPQAKDRGYTEEVLGCPIVPAAGLREKYYTTVPIGYEGLSDVQMCGEIVGADAMIVYSHGKGHGECGWGGAIKNIAMGNVTCKSRGDIHALFNTLFTWNAEACTHCYLCRDNCPAGAISFKDEKLDIFDHHCRYCMHCVTACPVNAITINEGSAKTFQAGMAHVTKACLDGFEPNRVLYINHVLNVTPFCDCWGFTSPMIVPDVGVLAGTDIAAVEQASIDMIRTEDFIPGSLPHPLEVRDVEGHLFQKIHGKDPYLQVEEAEAVGLGERSYETITVE
jgi:uncharacterized Fe-S center protein